MGVSKVVRFFLSADSGPEGVGQTLFSLGLHFRPSKNAINTDHPRRFLELMMRGHEAVVKQYRVLSQPDDVFWSRFALQSLICILFCTPFSVYHAAA